MEKKQKLSSETINSGKKANLTGNQLEKFVADLLISKGYTYFESHKHQMFSARSYIGGQQFQEQVAVGETIYKTSRKVDFLVINQELFPNGLIIECKWQQTGGSVDEKYPYLFFNIAKTGVRTIILLDGGGYSVGAGEWLRGQANEDRALTHVFNMAEFQKHANNGFLG